MNQTKMFWVTIDWKDTRWVTSNKWRLSISLRSIDLGFRFFATNVATGYAMALPNIAAERMY
jgi:hypothetical protein